MKRNKLAIIVALKSELSEKILNSSKLIKINNFECALYKTKTQKVLFIFSGVGKANAARATQFAISELKYKNILNIGSAGANKTDLQFKDVCLIKNARYIDVDTTIFGYKIGQVPHEPELFEIKSTNIKGITDQIRSLNLKVHETCNLGTADSFVNKNNNKGFSLTKDIDCIDMEGSSIVQVASKFKNINLLIIKVISDNKTYKKNHWTNNIEQIKTIISNIILTLTK